MQELNKSWVEVGVVYLRKGVRNNHLRRRMALAKTRHGS